jgi:hypothetical protein
MTQGMQFSARFYRAAAIASMLSAVTTLGLIFLPRLYSPVPDFEARMALGTHPAYVLRSWTYLVHPFLVFAAALAVAARCRFRAAGAASVGLAGFALWAATEAAQQALTKVALDRTWRAAWPAADEAAREVIRNHVAFYDVVWDAMYLLILLGFVIGSVFLALAVRRTTAGEGMQSRRLASWVSAAFWAGAGLTAIYLLPEFGGPQLRGTEWLYPLIQPAGRVLIGVWLWREAAVESAPTRAVTAAPG